MRSSVGEVLDAHDVVLRDAHEELTGDRVPPAELLGPIGTHVATGDACRPSQKLLGVRVDPRPRFDDDKHTGRSFVVEAQADAGVAPDRLSFHGVLAGQ